jgi:hypothetical protein
MQFKNVLTSLASLLLVAVLVTGCSEPLPSESPDGPVFAAAEATPFTFTYTANPWVMGEWTYTDGMLHVRGLISGGTIGGYVEGTATVPCEGDVHTATGAGPIRCHFTFEVTHLDGQTVNGTFEGEMRGRASGFASPAFVHTGHFVGHGTGDMAGKKIRGTYTNEANPGVSNYVGTGSILDPHGG